MLPLLLTLTPIALIDCFTPVRFSILAALLATKHPARMGYTFVLGIFFGYFAIGFLVLFGLTKFLEGTGGKFEQYWNTKPGADELVFQIIIGVLMIIFAYRAARPRKRQVEKAKKTEGLTLVPVFLMGFIPAFAPTPGMLPYFAAIDQIIKADLGNTRMVAALFYYNLVFLVPPSLLILIRLKSKETSDRIFGGITRFFATWGKGVVIGLVILLGAVLIADAVGFFFDRPLLPFNPAKGEPQATEVISTP